MITLSPRATEGKNDWKLFLHTAKQPDGSLSVSLTPDAFFLLGHHIIDNCDHKDSDFQALSRRASRPCPRPPQVAPPCCRMMKIKKIKKKTILQ